MGGWNDFFVAEAGASAALAGLIFVGVSISLDDLLRYPRMVRRAGGALALLMAVLVTASLMLAPDQSRTRAGLELLGVGLVAVGLSCWLGWLDLRDIDPDHRGPTWFEIALRLLTTGPIALAGIALLADRNGFDWLLPAYVGAFVVALLDAWVILVEIHR